MPTFAAARNFMTSSASWGTEGNSSTSTSRRPQNRARHPIDPVDVALRLLVHILPRARSTSHAHRRQHEARTARQELVVEPPNLSIGATLHSTPPGASESPPHPGVPIDPGPAPPFSKGITEKELPAGSSCGSSIPAPLPVEVAA